MLGTEIVRRRMGLERVPEIMPLTRNSTYQIVFSINIPHAVRNDVVDFLAIVPSPPQLILQLYTVSTGGERSCSF